MPDGRLRIVLDERMTLVGRQHVDRVVHDDAHCDRRDHHGAGIQRDTEYPHSGDSDKDGQQVRNQCEQSEVQ